MLSFRLRHSVILQKQSTQQDALGEPLPQWENIAVVWAEITPLKARDIVSAGAVQHMVSHRVCIRPRDDVIAGMRLLNRHMLYQIEAVLNQNDKEHHLLCSTGVRHG